MDKCPFCGADKGKGVLEEERTRIPLPDLVWFECGSILNQVRGPKCYETELTALRSLVWDAIDAMRWVHDNPDINAFLNRPEVRAVMERKQ